MKEMTGQIPDAFIYKEIKYAIVGLEGGPLFSPVDFGMEVKAPNTACWRGYIATYTCLDSKLVLTHLSVNTTTPKKLNNKTPIDNTQHFGYVYEDLGLKFPFTGTFIIARDFINEMYVHMGFQSPSSFREVHELTFEKGVLISEKNVSQQMEKQRETLRKEPSKPPSPEELGGWIEDRFSLKIEKDAEDKD